MSEIQGERVGVDLGNCYCSAAYWGKDRVHVIPNVYGHRKTCSYLSFYNDEIYIGEAARYSSASNSENVVYDILSLVGMRYSDGHFIGKFPFRICPGVNDGLSIQVSYKNQLTTFAPEELLALLLHHIKRDIDLYMSREATDVVLSISLILNLTQRKCIRDACTLAGLTLTRLIFSPSATAYAFTCMNPNQREELVLVVDCGGSSVSVSLSVVEQGICEVRSISGTSKSGGQAFDNALIQYCDEIIRRRFDVDISQSPKLLVRLRLACEQAKIALSTSLSTSIVVQNIKVGIDFRETITRTEFESIISNQLVRCLAAVDDALALAKVAKNRVQRLLLTGQSSRIPKIQDMLHRHFDGNLPVQIAAEYLSPVCGAAMNAAQLSNTPRYVKDDCDQWLEDSLWIDVQANEIGIVGPDGARQVIVPRGVFSVPVKRSISIVTTMDNQTSMLIPVWEGKRDVVFESYQIGMLLVSNIPAAPAGKQAVDITVTIDANMEGRVYATLPGQSEEILAQLLCGLELRAPAPQHLLGRHNDILCHETCVVRPRVEAENALENEIARSLKVMDSDVVVRGVQGAARSELLDFLTSTTDWLESHRTAGEDEFMVMRDRLVAKMKGVHSTYSSRGNFSSPSTPKHTAAAAAAAAAANSSPLESFTPPNSPPPNPSATTSQFSMPTDASVTSGEDAGVAHRIVDANFLEDGGLRSPLAGMFPPDLPQVSLETALAFCATSVPAVMASVRIALKKAKKLEKLHPGLSMDERAAIVLYTIESFPQTESVYYMLNSALRSVNRQSVRPWRDYIWLLLHGLKKLPPSDCRVVHRAMSTGLHELGENYCRNEEFQWSAFSSTTTHVEVLQSFLGQSGDRTMFQLELNSPVARDISQFSLYPNERELLLPPNVLFEVLSILNCGNGLHIIQCRQIDAEDMLLEY